MESLGRLGDKLPGAEAEEKELQASFRSAALAITGLFKQGKKATNKGESDYIALDALRISWTRYRVALGRLRVDATQESRESS